MKKDYEIINRHFFGDSATIALKVFRAIKRAGSASEEYLCEKLKMPADEITDTTDALRRAGFTASANGRHQASFSYRAGNL